MNDHNDDFLYGPLPDGYHDYERRRLKSEWDRRQGYIEWANDIDRVWKELYSSRPKADGLNCRTCHGSGDVMDQGSLLTCWKCDGTGVDAARIIVNHTAQINAGIVDRYIDGVEE